LGKIRTAVESSYLENTFLKNTVYDAISGANGTLKVLLVLNPLVFCILQVTSESRNGLST